MLPDGPEQTQLFLVTPPVCEPGLLSDALRSGRIAAVLIASGGNETEREAAAATLVPVVQGAGAAAIVADFTRVAGRCRADGVHIASGTADLRAAIETFRPGKIVGAAGAYSRHAAMEFGELQPDYLLFGKPHGDTHPEPHGKALELAEWWSELMEIPAVVMAGSTLESIATARATGAAFIGLHNAVWQHPAGPAKAVAKAADLLANAVEQAA